MMKNIIVADDDLLLVESMVERLRKAGYAVRAASSGKELLAWATADEPWLVIVGESLPDGNGLEVARRLEATTQSFTIMLCNPAKRQEGDDGWPRQSISMYLTKPFNMKELVVFVRRVYTHYQMEIAVEPSSGAAEL